MTLNLETPHILLPPPNSMTPPNTRMPNSRHPMLLRTSIILVQRNTAPRIHILKRVSARSADGDVVPASAGPPACGFAGGSGAALIVEEVEVPVCAVVGVWDGGGR